MPVLVVHFHFQLKNIHPMSRTIRTTPTNYIRRIRTQQERRAYAGAFDPEFNFAPRPRRNVRALPTAWDDKPVGAEAIRQLWRNRPVR